MVVFLFLENLNQAGFKFAPEVRHPLSAFCSGYAFTEHGFGWFFFYGGF
jgi:hypothetical protein